MTEQEIFEGLKEVFREIKPKMDLDKVNMESGLINDLGMDSLSMLLVSLASEEKFKMQFELQRPFSTVRDVVSYIKKQTD